MKFRTSQSKNEPFQVNKFNEPGYFFAGKYENSKTLLNTQLKKIHCMFIYLEVRREIVWQAFRPVSRQIFISMEI